MNFSRISFLILFSLLSIYTNAQQSTPSELSDKWKEIVRNIRGRNEKVLSITNYLSKQDYNKKELLKEFDSIQLASKKDLENVSLGDSLSVNKAWIQYQRATFSFWKLFTACEKHPALFEQQDFLKLLTQAGESEVKLSVAITNFNEACYKLKRNDLVFKELPREPPLPSDI